MMAIFLANHHYYDKLVGVFDSRIGRQIMNGTTFNPVLSVLKDNGYKVQYIERQAYLVIDQGNLDYAYPAASEPVYSGLWIFHNPVLDGLVANVSGASPIEEGAMAEVLFNRLQETLKGSDPWFTYVHFELPSHSSGPFLRDNQVFEDIYRERTRKANVHM